MHSAENPAAVKVFSAGAGEGAKLKVSTLKKANFQQVITVE